MRDIDDTRRDIEEYKERVARNRKNVLKSAALLGVGVTMIGLGAAGVIVLGKSLINRISSGELLTLSNYYGSELEMGGIGASAFASIVGAIGTVHSARSLHYDTDSLKSNKKDLLRLKKEYKLKKDE